VNLDRAEAAGGIFQLLRLGEALGIEIVPPGRVVPAADADANVGLGHAGSFGRNLATMSRASRAGRSDTESRARQVLCASANTSSPRLMTVVNSALAPSTFSAMTSATT